MICPVCKKVMLVIEYNEIELDYCNQCGGVWFDAGELELMLKSADTENDMLKNIFNSMGAATKEGKRRCPLCNKNMKKVNIGQPDILIDACEQGEGLWCDGGEILKLVKQFPAQPSGEDSAEQNMVDFLAEVFRAQK